MDLALEKIQQKIQINNILYDNAKFTLRPEALVELDKLVELLQRNPHLKIELRSHTDSKGSVKYNQKLSENRAKSAVDYLISRGIPSTSLSYKGYGESELLVKKEKTEADYQANRRTEITVTGRTGVPLYDTRMPETPSLMQGYSGVRQIQEAGYRPGQPGTQYQQQPTSQYQPQQPQATGAGLQNMPFSIQIAASTTYSMNNADFTKIKQMFNLEVYAIKGADGRYRYFAGGFNTSAEAKTMCDRINSAMGKGFFVKDNRTR
jgi:hypothetical protein